MAICQSSFFYSLIWNIVEKTCLLAVDKPVICISRAAAEFLSICRSLMRLLLWRRKRVILDLPDALLLARIQFAFTVSFHFLFPAITIGLASYLAVLEGLWLKTGHAEYMDLFRYWIKIFALVFAMGVVSGIVMSYQFGTNWAVFSDRAGPIIGPLMAYEVLAAFFWKPAFWA